MKVSDMIKFKQSTLLSQAKVTEIERPNCHRITLRTGQLSWSCERLKKDITKDFDLLFYGNHKFTIEHVSIYGGNLFRLYVNLCPHVLIHKHTH